MVLHAKFLFLWQATFRVSDVGLNILLKLFSMMLSLFGSILVLESLQKFTDGLPKSVSAAQMLTDTRNDNFLSLFVAPSVILCTTWNAV